MSNTSLKQKIFLGFIGIIVMLVLLEILLRLGGLLYNVHRDLRNATSFSSNEIRILCVGESTTALGGGDSYPSQLQQILNQRRPDKKFTVINKGMISSTSLKILAELEGWLDTYRPNIVVGMIGINDPLHSEISNTFWARVKDFFQDMRVYKFFKLLAERLEEKWKGQGMSSVHWQESSQDTAQEQQLQTMLSLLKESDIALSHWNDVYARQPQGNQREIFKQKIIEAEKQQAWILASIGRYYKNREDYAQAAKYFQMAIKFFPHNLLFYSELGSCYREQGYYQKALEIFQSIDSLPGHPQIAEIELARCFAALGRNQEARALYANVAYMDYKNIAIYHEASLWLEEHGYLQQAKDVLLKAIRGLVRDRVVYERLISLSEKMGNPKDAELYRKQLGSYVSFGTGKGHFTTYAYNKIVEDVLKRHIQFIGMQYPLHNIGLLKDILKSNRYFPKIVFVENKTNFQAALKREEYTTYFADNFAGDFGHCTFLGNKLIAENLADAVLKVINEPHPSL
ncbi:MAG: tetratricopeptide repeat protein [Candidatus Omnitrophica bacterium]|nr:tetratricopeptide repeat protein [Candidatus Omnitrophota bacterium]